MPVPVCPFWQSRVRILCGTTGESPTLSWDEECPAAPGSAAGGERKALVMAGTGSNSTVEGSQLPKKSCYKLD